MLSALGQRDAERARGGHGVVEEQLVEIAHAVEEQAIRVGRPDLDILLHHRRDAGGRLVAGRAGGCSGSRWFIRRRLAEHGRRGQNAPLARTWRALAGRRRACYVRARRTEMRHGYGSNPGAPAAAAARELLARRGLRRSSPSRSSAVASVASDFEGLGAARPRGQVADIRVDGFIETRPDAVELIEKAAEDELGQGDPAPHRFAAAARRAAARRSTGPSARPPKRSRSSPSSTASAPRPPI